MNTLQSDLATLISQTKLYIQQETSPQQWILSDRETCDFFRAYAQSQKKSTPSTSQQIVPIPSAKEQMIPAPPLRPIKTEPLPTPPAATLKPPTQETEKSPPQAITPGKIQKKEVLKSDNSTPQRKIFLPSQDLLPLAECHFDDFRKIMAERFPNQTLLDTIPSDAAAKQEDICKDSTFSEVLLISCDDNHAHNEFLGNIAKAIQNQLSPAEIVRASKIEQEDGWHSLLNSKKLRLLIICDSQMQSFPKMMEHYRENSKSAKQYLGKIPLFLLADLSLYLREPKFKAPLWQALKKTLTSRTEPALQALR